MRVFFNQEVNKIVIDESIIRSLSWVNHFKDIAIDIDWCGQEDLAREIDFTKVNSSLYFEFVTEAEFNFKFEPTTMGGVEITSFTFDLKDEVWSIEFKFNFYPVGHIKFKCNDFKFIIESGATKL